MSAPRRVHGSLEQREPVCELYAGVVGNGVEIDVEAFRHPVRRHAELAQQVAQTRYGPRPLIGDRVVHAHLKFVPQTKARMPVRRYSGPAFLSRFSEARHGGRVRVIGGSLFIHLERWR